MLTVRVSKKNGRVKTVEAKGHTGYAEEGSDIICSAVSALTQTALLGLIKVAKAETKYETRDGYLSFTVTETDSVKLNAADIILQTMCVGIKDISSGYPEYVKTENF
ncbi:MAG: ribosomal-processing cysteine protease Prp [Christensenellaceae bacterium]|nr:ribosomal-processing cysteine protease Prp [Christensenellaceae bacterium]